MSFSDKNDGCVRWYDSNEDLEKEAVNIIKSQQTKIHKLTTENKQLTEAFEQLTGQLKSMEEYKREVEMLSMHVGEYEDKFRNFEKANLKNEMELRESTSREAQLRHQINSLSTSLDTQSLALKEKTAELEDVRRRFENYKQSHKKSETMYGEEQFNLRKSMIETENAKKELEGKLADYSAQLKKYEKENAKLRTQAKDYEKAYKNATLQIEQNIANLEEHERYIKELKEENKNVKVLSQRVKECNKKIEMIYKEMMKEKEENGKLRKENERLEQELDVINYRTTGENSPQTLKKYNRKCMEQIEVLEGEKAELLEKIESLNAEMIAITKLCSVLKESLIEMNTEKRQEIVTIIESIADRNLAKVAKELTKAAEQAIVQNEEMEKANQKLREELASTQALKDTILTEVERFKTSLADQNENIQRQESEVSSLQKALADAQASLKEQEDLLRLRCEELAAIAHKFEETDFVTKNVNLKLISDSHTDPQQTMKELVGMMADLTNVLSFEVKASNIKNSRTEENLKQAQDENLKNEQTIKYLQEQINALKEEAKKIKAAGKEKTNDFIEKEEKYAKLCETFGKEIIKDEKRIAVLIEQKAMLNMMNNNTKKAIINIQEQLNNVLGEKEKPTFPQKRLAAAMKFRKAVICVIAFNKLLKYRYTSQNKPSESLLKKIQEIVARRSLTELVNHSVVIDVIQAAKFPPPKNSVVARYSALRIISDGLKSMQSKFGGPAFDQTIQHLLAKIDQTVKDLVNVSRELESSKEREEELVLQLQKANNDCEEYSENTHKMARIVDELHSKLDTMVPAKSYEEIRQILEDKNREIEELSIANCEVRRELQVVRNGISEMEARIKSVDDIVNKERKRAMQAECELQMAQSKCKAIEEALLNKEDEIQELRGKLKRSTEETHELKETAEQLKDYLIELEKAKEEIERLEGVIAEGKEKEKLVEFYKEKSVKYEEIIKLQEMNLNNMEKKCEMLEAAITDLSKENNFLKTQPKTKRESEIKDMEMFSSYPSEPEVKPPAKSHLMVPGRLATQSVYVQGPSASIPEVERSYQLPKYGPKVPGTILKK